MITVTGISDLKKYFSVATNHLDNSIAISKNELLSAKGKISTEADSVISDIVYNNNIAVMNSIQPISIKSMPTQPSIVTTQAGDRRIFMQRRNTDGTLSPKYAVTIKGVNWGPASVGSDPKWNPEGYKQENYKWFKIDIPLMAKMGINSVRVYHDFGTGPDAIEILDEFYKYGIGVIMTTDSPLHGDVANLDNITAVVNAYKNHPAMLMWSVGNEWDINYYYGKFSNLTDSQAFTEQAAQLIHSLDPNHPVTTFIIDPLSNKYLSPDSAPWVDESTNSHSFLSNIVKTYVSNVDVWGLNIYRNSSFTDVFSQWETISDKPMFIGEFGADSYNHLIGSQDETLQNDFDLGLYNEIHYNLASERTNGICSGSLVFEWNDEWWKNGSPSVHNITSEVNYGQPDGYNDEEHFGIVDIDRVPKEAFYGLKNIFAFNGYQNASTNDNPTLTINSYNPNVWEYNGLNMLIDNKTVYSRGGGGAEGRGFIIGIFDKDTGIRMKDYRHFDTLFLSQHQPMLDYLQSIPNGSIVTVGISDSTYWNYNINSIRNYLKTMGSTQIDNVSTQDGWAMIVQKGGTVLSEHYTANGMATAQKTFNLITNKNADRRQAVTELVPFHVTSLDKQNKITFESQKGIFYSIEYCDDLKTANWETAQRGILGVSTNTSWIDDGSFTKSLPTNRFYRINAVDRAWLVE